MQDYKQLELSFETQKDMVAWKSAFLRAGVDPMKVLPTAFGKEMLESFSLSMEPQLKRRVIRNLLLLWV